jgi:hypothetical protein
MGRQPRAAIATEHQLEFRSYTGAVPGELADGGRAHDAAYDGQWDGIGADERGWKE